MQNIFSTFTGPNINNNVMSKNLNRDYWNESLLEHYPKLIEFTEYAFHKMKECKNVLID